MDNPDAEFAASREEIKRRHPLLEYARERGWKLKRDGTRHRCLCPLHDEQSPSFVISNDLWKCFGCGRGGSVIDLHAALKNISIGEAMRELGGEAEKNNGSRERSEDEDYDPFAERVPGKEAPADNEVASYKYHDALGREIYEVVRFHPKDFRQARIKDGARIWSMDGVERVPYHLPDLLAKPQSVWIVEGEKDVEVLRAIGQTATCNPGGAGKWLPAFSQYLKDACVFICPDRDDPGEKHGRGVLKSLEGLVQWVKWVTLPPEFNGIKVKDVADLWAALLGDREKFVAELLLLQQKAPLIERAIESHCFTMLELESHYVGENTRFSEVALRLPWNFELRSLGPGDVLGIMAGTGQLKTALAQNILACNAHLPSLFFQLELSSALMFERLAAISTGISANEIQELYEQGLRVDWRSSAKFERMLVSTANVSMNEVDDEIARASAKLGVLPKVFVVDYVQLVRGTGSRYERVSNACEDAKRIAKKWNVISILVSQVSRKKIEAGDEDEVREVYLHDAKESGSFENTCSVVLGLWKTSQSAMQCRVLKNSKGCAGQVVDMRLRGSTFIIE